MFEYLNGKYLNDVDVSVLSSAVQQKVSEQCLSENFMKFVNLLYKNEQLFHDILLHHHLHFPNSIWNAKRMLIHSNILNYSGTMQHCSVHLQPLTWTSLLNIQ